MMQTPKKRNGSSEVPKKASPVTTPRSARKTNMNGTESDSTVPASAGGKSPTSKSPKVVERRSPRSPVTERKKPNRISELESQLTQLQEDLKKAKDQLASSESSKRCAGQEAEEANKQLVATSAKLEDTQRQLQELSESEDARVQELRKIGQERDKAWQSELEAVQKQQSVDSTALFSAMTEIQRLKQQLEITMSSEAAQVKNMEMANSELAALKLETAETLSLVETLKSQLKEFEKSEEESQKLVNETQIQLEMAKATTDTLRAEFRYPLKAVESLNSVASELAESKAKVSSLEDIVRGLQQDGKVNGGPTTIDTDCIELHPLHLEIEKLKSALDAAEMRCQEEQIKSTMQIQSAHEAVERTKIEAGLRESELELALKEIKIEVAELKANLTEKDKELQSRTKLNSELGNRQYDQSESELEQKLKKSMSEVADLKANLLDKETELQSIMEENDVLKSEMEKKGAESSKINETAKAEVETARAAEKDALMRIGIVTEESDKNSKKVSRMTEQLEAAEAANSEMEAELKRLRIQSEQWRKAAEAAATILTTGNNGRLMERSGSLDPNYNSIGGKLLNSPFSDDIDDESPKKKNNMLKKIGVLWRKGQK